MIEQGTDIVLTIQDRSSWVEMRGNTMYEMSLYLSQYGGSLLQPTFQMQVVAGDVMAFNIIELCQGEWEIPVDDSEQAITALGEAQVVTSVPNLYAYSEVSFMFQVSSVGYSFKTGIQIELGYLHAINVDSLLLNKFQCTPYQREDVVEEVRFVDAQGQEVVVESRSTRTWHLSSFFEKAYYEQESIILPFKSPELIPPEAVFAVNCTGLRNPDSASTQPIYVHYIDLSTANSIIQSAVIHRPFGFLPANQNFASEPTVDLVLYEPQVRLARKYFNSPYSPSAYVFTVLPEVPVQVVYIQFDISFSPDLSYLPLYCAINARKTRCTLHAPRTVAIYTPPLQSEFNVTVDGVIQPEIISMDPRIWVGLDSDRQIDALQGDATGLNGINQQGVALD